MGPTSPIRRDYPIEEYRADLDDLGVAKSVYVQTNWPPEAYEEEAAWVQRTADKTGWPHAIVAYAEVSANDVRPQLDRLSHYPLVHGVRMQLHWHENPQYRFASRPNLVADPRIRRNVGYLADYGLSFDLQVFAPQMADAADLAESCPKVTFVLQHAGMLEDLSAAGRAEWRSGMVRLAACPNVTTKLSGLGTFLHRNDPAHIAEIVRETVQVFGAGPVCVRLELSGREALDLVWRASRSLQGRRGFARAQGTASDSARYGDARLSYRAIDREAE